MKKTKPKFRNNLQYYMDLAGMTYVDFENEPTESRVTRVTIWKILKNHDPEKIRIRTLRKIHKAIIKITPVKFSKLFPGQID